MLDSWRSPGLGSDSVIYPRHSGRRPGRHRWSGPGPVEVATKLVDQRCAGMFASAADSTKRRGREREREKWGRSTMLCKNISRKRRGRCHIAPAETREVWVRPRWPERGSPGSELNALRSGTGGEWCHRRRLARGRVPSPCGGAARDLTKAGRGPRKSHYGPVPANLRQRRPTSAGLTSSSPGLRRHRPPPASTGPRQPQPASAPASAGLRRRPPSLAPISAAHLRRLPPALAHLRTPPPAPVSGVIRPPLPPSAGLRQPSPTSTSAPAGLRRGFCPPPASARPRQPRPTFPSATGRRQPPPPSSAVRCRPLDSAGLRRSALVGLRPRWPSPKCAVSAVSAGAGPDDDSEAAGSPRGRPRRRGHRARAGSEPPSATATPSERRFPYRRCDGRARRTNGGLLGDDAVRRRPRARGARSRRVGSGAVHGLDVGSLVPCVRHGKGPPRPRRCRRAAGRQ